MTKPVFLQKYQKKELDDRLYLADSFHNLKEKCKELGIKNSKDYRKNYKEYGLPAHPERIYKEHWKSYRDFFDIKDFLSYIDLTSIIRGMKLKNQKEYRAFVLNSNYGCKIYIRQKILYIEKITIAFPVFFINPLWMSWQAIFLIIFSIIFAVFYT
jgi:hypothetical protein